MAKKQTQREKIAIYSDWIVRPMEGVKKEEVW
jgi:hypothetical protein